MKFFLCIDDTDDMEKTVGTGEIAQIIFSGLKREGCKMEYTITRHQLLLDDNIDYTSHNSSMCMEGETDWKKEDLLDFAEKIVLEHMSPASNPGICLYFPTKKDDIDKVTAFGEAAKKYVISLEQAAALQNEIENLYLIAPGGNGNGMIGALAGVGLRMSGMDGTFRGKVKTLRPGCVLSVKEAKKVLHVDYVIDFEAKELPDDVCIRSGDHVKIIYYRFKRAIAVFKTQDDAYEICSLAFEFESGFRKDEIMKKDCCRDFVWDNDTEEQWSEAYGACQNCLYRELYAGGMRCRKG